LNGANEVAVEAFLAGALNFPAIAATVAETLRRATRRQADSLENILAADAEARELAKSIVESGPVS
jgi:1-deoxy-D-xylulose-5-phosphate reductoisomerase